MIEKDRAVAQMKASSIIQKIGYSTKNPDVLDSKSVETYYSALNISNETYVENKARAALSNTQLEW